MTIKQSIFTEEGCHTLREARGCRKEYKGCRRLEEILMEVEDFHPGWRRECWYILNVRKGGRSQAKDIKGGLRLNLCEIVREISAVKEYCLL